MVALGAPAFSDHPAVRDQESDAEYWNQSAQYRRPRRRVAYIQAGDGETPADDPEPYSGAHRWSEPRPNAYETDWSPPRRRKGRRRARRPARTMSMLVAMGALAVAVGGAVAMSGADAGRPTAPPVAIDAAFEEKPTVPKAATRGKVRAAPTPAASAAVPAPSTKAARPARSSPRPRRPRPVAGLSQTQMNNAAVIVQVAQERSLPRRAMLVAMMTGMQESSLRNLANPSVPASLDRPNEGSGSNFDSLGVFQQRPSQGWGTVSELMNPRYAADAFYARLLKVSDWESRSLGAAAQAVQRSAVPGAYAEHEKRAAQIVDALL